MKANKQPFYNEFMLKESPRVPRCICPRGARRWIGIVSPSLCWLVSMGYKGEKARLELEAFERNRLRYVCYKRIMTKEQWKELYREYRKEQWKKSYREYRKKKLDYELVEERIMNLSNKANQIAGRLQQEATVKYGKQRAEVAAEKKGYIQTYEDFARE